MTIKFTKKQLRSLISEAIESREAGSPLWQFNESPGGMHKSGPRADSVDLGLSNFVEEVVKEEWKNIYDAGDPSIQDPEEWNEQVEAAAEELHDRLTAAVREVEEKLINGEFHDFDGSEFR
jgi:hypothetical protein